MPIARIPLVGPMTARGHAKTVGTSVNDQQFINALFEVSIDEAQQTKRIYCIKRPGHSAGTAISGFPKIIKHYCSGIGAIFDSSTSIRNASDTSYGTTSFAINGAMNSQVADSIVDDVEVVAAVSGTSNTGWFLWEDAISNNFTTFSASLTSGGFTLSAISDTTGIYPGQAISGTGIPASARVSTVDSSSLITSSLTLTSSGVQTVTKEAIANIIDADFPSDANSIAQLDGYFFAGASSGKIYQSALNDPSSWNAANVIATDYSADALRFIFRHKNYIVACGTLGYTIQYFYNAGNATGSVLSRATHLDVHGLSILTTPLELISGSYCIASTTTVLSVSQPRGLYKLTGINNFQKISYPIVDGILQDLGLDKLSPATLGDKQILVIHGSNSNPCVVYDESANEFSLLYLELGSFNSGWGQTLTIGSKSFYYTWDTGDTFQDDATNITLTIQLAPWDGGTLLEKTIHSVALVGDNEASGTASLSWSDDDGTTFSTARTLDMTKVDKRTQPCGVTRRRVFKLTHTGTTPFRATALEIEYTVNPTNAGVK